MIMYRLIIIFSLAFIYGESVENQPLAYWQYSQNDIDALRQIKPPQQKITERAITKWDNTLYELTANDPLPDGMATRFFAYLYVAQRDAAFLSSKIHEQFLGTLDPITAQVITYFFPNYNLKEVIDSDPFSLAVAKIVFEKVKTRYENEQKELKLYPAKIGKEYWKESEPIVGQKVGSAHPWLVGQIQQFRLPEPSASSSIIWAFGLDEIKKAQSRLTPEQKNSIEYWGSLQGVKSGNWFAVANDYLANLSPSLDLKDFLFMRSIYAMCLVDALIAVFDNKYSYWVLRPHMLDPSLTTLIAVPKHPSYPSGHSVISAAAATTLSYFFPKDADKWRKTAIDAGNSRIAAGLHYMIDNEDGLILGEKIANAAIQNSNHQER